ncbi:RodZ domain-containing protein [Alteromonas sp. H39]|uniref:RodZ domain-containing protein n=1 Tax=Alteromonas sp. H39 TaxID=3389876 RepID=UPI0039E02154
MVSEQEQNTDVQETNDAPKASPGKLLREGREAQGLSQQDIASKLFLKASQIDDIEHDRLDDRMSVTFTKGYVRNYAKQLGLDSQRVVEEFERCHNTPKSSAKLQSFSRRVAKQAHDDRWMMVTWIIALLLIGGVVAWWYQQSVDEPLTQEPVVQSENTADVYEDEDIPPLGGESAVSENGLGGVEPLGGAGAVNTSQTAVVEADELAEDESVETRPDADESATTQDGDDAVTASVDVDERQPAADESTREASSPSADATPINMVFTFGEDCWVNIEDATGEAIAYGVKQAGRVMSIQGVPPVEVTLGAPDNVTITVDGEPVDMSSYQNGRTARLSLPTQE